MKKLIIKPLIAVLFTVILHHTSDAQLNPSADPSLIEVVTSPDIMMGPNHQAITTVRVLNGGFDPIPANSILVSITFNQYFNFTSVANIPGFIVYYEDNETVVLENNVALEPLSVRDLSVNSIAVQSTGPDGMGGFQQRPYAANISIKPEAASNVGNMSALNDNVDANIIVGNVALPLKLLSFTGTTKNCVTTLNWETASEENTYSFEIEKSTDGLNFTLAGRTEAKGQGDHNYLQTISQAEKVVYYRLKMIDIDRSAKYSKVIRVVSDCSSNSFSVYPNPASKSSVIALQCSSDKLVYYRIMNSTGKLVRSGSFLSKTELRDLGPGGTYYVEMRAGSETRNITLVIQ